jgi:hypothetical protein
MLDYLTRGIIGGNDAFQKSPGIQIKDTMFTRLRFIFWISDIKPHTTCL